MRHNLRLGSQVYYVPRFDERLARYVPVTRLHLSLAPPLVTLDHQLVIAPGLRRTGASLATTLAITGFRKTLMKPIEPGKRSPCGAAFGALTD